MYCIVGFPSFLPSFLPLVVFNLVHYHLSLSLSLSSSSSFTGPFLFHLTKLNSFNLKKANQRNLIINNQKFKIQNSKMTSDNNNNNNNNNNSNNNKRCTCLPYNDGLLITAQILSFIAIILSWSNLISILFGLVAFICLQVVWCCRMKTCGLITVGILTSIASIVDLITGIYIFVEGPKSVCDKSKKIIDTLFMQDENEEDINNINNDMDLYCGPWMNLYGGFALAGGTLWLIIAFLIFYFTCGNRIKRFNDNHNNTQKGFDTAEEAQWVRDRDECVIPRATTNGVNIVMDDNERGRERELESRQINQNRSVTGVVTGDADSVV